MSRSNYPLVDNVCIQEEMFDYESQENVSDTPDKEIICNKNSLFSFSQDILLKIPKQSLRVTHAL